MGVQPLCDTSFRRGSGTVHGLDIGFSALDEDQALCMGLDIGFSTPILGFPLLKNVTRFSVHNYHCIFFCLHGVAQVAMAVEMKSHRTEDLGFDSCATLPRNRVNNKHVKTRK